MELSTEPKPRFPRLISRPFKQSPSMKLRKVDTTSSKHLHDIARDQMPPPPSVKRGRKGSAQDISREMLSLPPAKQGRKGFMKFLSRAVPCTLGQGTLLEPEDLCSPEGDHASPSVFQREAAPSRNKFSTASIGTRGSFDRPTRASHLPRLSPDFDPTTASARGGHYWPSTIEMGAPPLQARVPPSPTNVVLSPRASISSSGVSTREIIEVDNNESIHVEVLSDLSIVTETPEDRDSPDHATNTSSDEQVSAPRRMSWTDIFSAMRNNTGNDAASLPMDDLETFLSAYGLTVCKKESAVEEMSLFQLNKVVTDHEERDAQTIMNWLVIHPEATGFLSSYPALTRLVEVDTETNEIVNTTSFINITGDLVGEDDGDMGDHAPDSMDSLPSVYSQQTSPSHSAENVPQLILTLPTESDLARELVSEEEECIPAPELLNIAWAPTPKRRRRVYSATPVKRRVSRLRKVASAPDLQLIAAGSGFEDSDDEDTIAASCEVSGIVSARWMSFSTADSSVGIDDASTFTFLSEEERRKSDPDVAENMLVANLLPDTSFGSFSSNRGRVTVLDPQVGLDDLTAASVSAPDVAVALPAEDDGVSVSGFVSAPSSPMPDTHLVDSADGEAVDSSACENQGCPRPVGIYGPVDMESLRSQMNKVEKIIIATASQRASMSAPGTPVESQASPKDLRDSKARRRGSMGYKPRPISGIRPLMLPMRVALRELDDDGNSRTVTHPPGTITPEDAPSRTIVPF